MAGEILGAQLVDLARELGARYLAGDLFIVAGAGVSRASGLPGWADMVRSLQASAAEELRDQVTEDELEAVLANIHGSNPLSRADSLQRLVTTPLFHRFLHQALYGPTRVDPFRPSASHWHIASLVDRRLMRNVFTSNYDDLLEDAKRALNRSGRVRHFHGRLPQSWGRATRLYDPPVVTSRDYFAAEDERRYERLAAALRDKTVLLVGLSLSDPNLARIIRNEARDCRAILVASSGGLDRSQQSLRLGLLRRFWRGLNINVTAIDTYEQLPAFLLALRREVAQQRGRSLSEVGSIALRASVIESPFTWPGARLWRARLRDAVVAAKAVAKSVRGDRTLRAGFYAIARDRFLEHVVSSAMTRDSYARWPRRRLLAEDLKPWGAAGYAFAAGVPIASASTGSAFDRNVPERDLIAWQAQRAHQGRLPAASVLCVPAWVRYDRRLVPIGVLYFSSGRGAAFDDREEAEELRAVLQLTLSAMIRPERDVEGGVA